MRNVMFWLTATGVLPLLALGAVMFMVMLAASAMTPVDAPAPNACLPCPTRTDNVKLREAYASCDQRAKEMERRWLEARSK